MSLKSDLVNRCKSLGIKTLSRDTIKSLKEKIQMFNMQNPNADVLNEIKRKYKRALNLLQAGKQRAANRYFFRVRKIAYNNFGGNYERMLSLHNVNPSDRNVVLVHVA